MAIMPEVNFKANESKKKLMEVITNISCIFICLILQVTKYFLQDNKDYHVHNFKIV